MDEKSQEQCKDCAAAAGIIAYRDDTGTIWLCRECYEHRKLQEHRNGSSP